MAKNVNFNEMFSYDVIPDVYEMDEAQLRSYREDLEDRIARLDAMEPRSERSEAYEDWADVHEELEDLLDEVIDRFEELGI